MSNYELRERTKQFALRIIRMCSALPKTDEARVLGKQLLRSGTSVAANYREAARARSDSELLAKLGVVEQELDESLLWMELRPSNTMNQTAKNAKVAKKRHRYSVPSLAHLAFLAVQIVRCSNCGVSDYACDASG